ncbi:type III secretion system protein [Erwinia amylovora]|uniref:SpaN/EivJ family type III secretion system needle length determinant n=1 Tax=Erwinia amylovora TaxID=552 RepID=UPI0014442642|nr:type III secretion system protein [Erwinia amylovora]
MVKEVCEALVNPVADVDISPVEEDFSDRVSKRKEEDSQSEIESATASLRHMLHQFSTSSIYGGGTAATDNERIKASALKKCQHNLDTHQVVFNEQLRRKSILAPAGIGLSTHRELKQPAGAEKRSNDKPPDINKLALTGINKAALEKQFSGLDINLSSQVKVHIADGESALVGNSLLTQQSEQQLRQPVKTYSVSADAKQADVIPVDVATSQRSETSARGENAQMARETLQKHMSERTSMVSASKADAASRSMDLKYQFKSWPGEHSVKVSVCTEVSRGRNIILHPSDPQAADALTRQSGNLAGYTPEIVQPRHGREEHEQQKQHRDTQEEEQE